MVVWHQQVSFNVSCNLNSPIPMPYTNILLLTLCTASNLVPSRLQLHGVVEAGLGLTTWPRGLDRICLTSPAGNGLGHSPNILFVILPAPTSTTTPQTTDGGSTCRVATCAGWRPKRNDSTQHARYFIIFLNPKYEPLAVVVGPAPAARRPVYVVGPLPRPPG